MPDTAILPQAARAANNGSGIGQLLRDPDHYEEINVIGNGAYGTVYKARDTLSDTIVAIKKVKLALTEDGVPMSVLREISLLKQLGKANHPNIVRLLDICHGQRLDREMVLYLVFEHVDQDLNLYIERCPPPGLAPDRIKDIMWQILSGVDFLHSHRIVHRDLKPQNILVSREGSVKLADFGLARIYDFSSLLTTVVVTLWYRSPEILLGTTYATPVDLWSCGCILAELFLRRPLFPGQYEVDQLGKIFGVLGTPSEAEWPPNSSVVREAFSVQQSQGLDSLMAGLDPQALDLLKKLLVFSSDQRISAGKALLHPYFSEFGFTPLSVSPTSDFASEGSSDSLGGHSMSETSNSGSSEPNTSLSPNNVSVNTSMSPTNVSTSFSSHETSGDSLGDLSGNIADATS